MQLRMHTLACSAVFVRLRPRNIRRRNNTKCNFQPKWRRRSILASTFVPTFTKSRIDLSIYAHHCCVASTPNPPVPSTNILYFISGQLAFAFANEQMHCVYTSTHKISEHLCWIAPSTSPVCTRRHGAIGGNVEKSSAWISTSPANSGELSSGSSPHHINHPVRLAWHWHLSKTDSTIADVQNAIKHAFLTSSPQSGPRNAAALHCTAQPHNTERLSDWRSVILYIRRGECSIVHLRPLVFALWLLLAFSFSHSLYLSLSLLVWPHRTRDCKPKKTHSVFASFTNKQRRRAKKFKLMEVKLHDIAQYFHSSAVIAAFYSQRLYFNVNRW